MSNVRSTLEYGAMGAGVCIFLWVVFAFFPSLMVSLSVVDTIFDRNDSFGSACLWFFIIFIILGFIQVGLIVNIRYTWGIVVPWFLLSIHPFFYWLRWLFDGDIDKVYNGINWMPW